MRPECPDHINVLSALKHRLHLRFHYFYLIRSLLSPLNLPLHISLICAAQFLRYRHPFSSLILTDISSRILSICASINSIKMVDAPYSSGANNLRIHCPILNAVERWLRYCSVTSWHSSKRWSKSAFTPATASL